MMQQSESRVLSPEPELDRFDVISLDDLKNSDASLLNRKERKFLMRRDQLRISCQVLAILTGCLRLKTRL